MNTVANLVERHDPGGIGFEYVFFYLTCSLLATDDFASAVGVLAVRESDGTHHGKNTGVRSTERDVP